MKRTVRAAEAVKVNVVRAVEALEAEPDPWVRERTARDLAEYMRQAQELFADQRTAAFLIFREEYDYSLADLKAEFGLSRPRAAQIINRDAYKERHQASKHIAKKGKRDIPATKRRSKAR